MSILVILKKRGNIMKKIIEQNKFNLGRNLFQQEIDKIINEMVTLQEDTKERDCDNCPWKFSETCKECKA